MPDRRRDDPDWVPHPRYGRGPRRTGLDPDPADPDVHLHWNALSGEEIAAGLKRAGLERLFPTSLLFAGRRIPGTAVAADLSRQVRATVPVTHYFDVPRTCRKCGRPFLFFAEEQKHWYETLKFPLEADAVRCVKCRAEERTLARARKRYERLANAPARTGPQDLQMVDDALTLVEEGIFGRRVLTRLRAVLKKQPRPSPEADRLRKRLSEIPP